MDCAPGLPFSEGPASGFRVLKLVVGERIGEDRSGVLCVGCRGGGLAGGWLYGLSLASIHALVIAGPVLIGGSTDVDGSRDGKSEDSICGELFADDDGPGNREEPVPGVMPADVAGLTSGKLGADDFTEEKKSGRSKNFDRVLLFLLDMDTLSLSSLAVLLFASGRLGVEEFVEAKKSGSKYFDLVLLFRLDMDTLSLSSLALALLFPLFKSPSESLLSTPSFRLATLGMGGS